MTELKLDVRLDGFENPVGTLFKTTGGRLEFNYCPQYKQIETSLPLSLSLPLTLETHGDVLTRAFFDNLLQERDGPLQDLMAREGIERDDVAGLLLHLGKDCAGAISVLPEGAPPVKVPGDFSKDYDVVRVETISEIVRSLRTNNKFPAGTQDSSPLAGVQNKFAIAILPDGNYAFPKTGSGAPTTHIIKVPKPNYPTDAKLECEALRISKATEIETAESEIARFDGIETLVVKRFDRALNEQEKVIRIHQEDFAQAMGLPRELKYERHGREGRRFDVQSIARILNETAEPAVERSHFIGATFFDLLIGNADGHAKNHALIYNNGNRPNLSPRYDILPTRLNADLNDELPFQIGAAKRFEEMTLADLNNYLKILGIATETGRKRIMQNAIRKLSQDLVKNFVALQQQGLKRFADLIASNCRMLCMIANVEVPAAAQSRDAFIPRGGGWYSS
jgi:serine/threonine-protein kinase HipA